MSAQRSTQQDKYAIDYQSSIDVPVTCLNGIDTGKSGIFILEHSSFEANQKRVDSLKTVFSASRNYNVEFKNTIKRPEFLFTSLLSTKQAFPFFRLFFQKGSLQDSSTPTIKWFYPYSYEENGSSCEIWGTIVRELSSGESLSQRVSGAIIKELSLSSNASEYLSLKSNIIARDVDINYNSSGDNFNITNEPSLLWRNCITKIGNSYTTLETLDLKGFNIFIGNNAIGKVFNNSLIKKIILGRVVGRGTISVPWENTSSEWANNTTLQELFLGKIMRFSLYWNNQYCSTGNSLSINCLIRYIDGKISQDNEISNEMSFILVGDSSFSSENNKISTWSIDNIDSKVMHYTFPGTQTLLGNVFPGDVVLTNDASIGNTTRWTIEKILDSNSIKLISNHSAGVGASGTSVTILRQPINIGLNDNINRNIT